MNQPESRNPRGTAPDGEDQLPAYVPPKIVTYTSEELLEQVGPALTCSPTPCGIPAGSLGQPSPERR
jgi:hypothetical protein